MSTGDKPMITRMSWEDFRATGMLWFANRLLHVFGIALVLEFDDSGTCISAYPARCRFRGFSEETESDGFVRVSKYMTHASGDLLDEATS